MFNVCHLRCVSLSPNPVRLAVRSGGLYKRMRWRGEHVSVNAVEFFRKGMKPGPPSKRQTRVSSIEINGNAASARLEIDYPTFRFIDYMNLLKIDGEWKIVSKIFFREMRPKQE